MNKEVRRNKKRQVMSRGRFSTKKRRRTGSGAALESQQFARFGLAAGEARTEVIRKAIRKYARSLAVTADHWMSERLDAQLVSIVWSAYCLLDPRRRRDAVERVQLAYPIDRFEQEIPALQANALWQRPQPALKGKAEELVPVELVKWVDSAVQVTHVEEKREIVRLLKEDPSDDPKPLMSVVRKWLFASGSVLVAGFLGWQGMANFNDRSHASNTKDPQSTLERQQDIQLAVAPSISGQADDVMEWIESAASAPENREALPSESIPSQILIAKTDLPESPKAAEDSSHPVMETPAPTYSPIAIAQSRKALGTLWKTWTKSHSSDVTSQAKLEVAQQWLDESPTGSADRLVLLESLAKLTAEQHGLPSGLAYCDQIECEFARSAWALRLELFEHHYLDGNSIASHREMAEIGIQLCERALSVDEYRTATRLIRMTMGAAGRSQDRRLIDTAIRLRGTIFSAKARSTT